MRILFHSHKSLLFTIGNRVYSNPHEVGSNPAPSEIQSTLLNLLVVRGPWV